MCEVVKYGVGCSSYFGYSMSGVMSGDLGQMRFGSFSHHELKMGWLSLPEGCV